MPIHAYYESLWEGVPEGLAPSDARLREAFLLEQVRDMSECLGHPPRVLDVGCGEGHFSAALTKEGVEAVAIDVATEPLRRALARVPDLDVRLIEPEGELPFEDSSFDVVWAGEVIEHVADTSRWLSELRRTLRSGGRLLISTPDHGPLTRLRLALSRSAFEERLNPRSDHLRFYTRRGLTDLYADFGFEEISVIGAAGVPGARRVLLGSGRRSRF
ncbi:MAG TPA: methyltransferase domain-containing protein [Solirubrobacteraceae bacterium]|jgi:ubiquinone/menaquinone biosynthesis C-methylase UbiE